jgi:transcription initiation factor TFIIF subunit beta
MPENELLDRIFQCFQDYKYWSMKTLKKNLEQPETYLRQTLEKVANLHKSGTFANRWSLKPENIRVAAPNVDEVAPDVNDGDASDEGEDENDIKMEDVMPS